MTTKPRVPTEVLIELYAEHRSVAKVGEIVGLHGGTVHARLKRRGLTNPANEFTKEEDDRLKREYRIFRDAGKLDELAELMGRPKTSLARRARGMGLTDKDAPKKYHAVWKYMSADAAEVIWEKFKATRKNLGQFCHDEGIDSLGFSRCMKEHFGDEWEHVIESKANRQTRYRIGRQFEYRIRDDLKDHGYFVMRSPQSKSPVDLVAIKTGRVVFIQCKRGGSLPPGEWNKFYDLCMSVDAEPVMASMDGYRGSNYYLLTGRKDGSKRRQPMEPGWQP